MYVSANGFIAERTRDIIKLNGIDYTIEWVSTKFNDSFQDLPTHSLLVMNN